MNDKINKLLEQDGDAGIPKKSKGTYASKKRIINEICNELNEDTKKYNPQNTKKLFEEYTKEECFLYSEISNYIFSLGEEESGRFAINLNSLIEYCTEEQKIKDEKLKRLLLKFYDHSQLAIAQTKNLAKDDEEFKKMIETKLIPVYSEMEKKIEKKGSDMTSQLVSLVAMFTALSFLVFGGISSLDNIFSGALDIPVIKLMMVGCIWGICILNLIFVFIYFVAKLLGVDIKTNRKSSANFIQRYPFTVWSNFIIFTIFLLLAWLYYIEKQKLGGWFIRLANLHKQGICLSGFLIIGILFVITARYIINKSGEKCE